MISHVYQWSGITANGQRVQGREAAANTQNLVALLKSRGITALKFKKISHWQYQHSSKMTGSQLAEFTRQLAVLIQAHVELVHALQIIIQENQYGALGKLSATLKNHLENGLSFAEALRHFPHRFDIVYCELIAAGEQAGTLGIILMQLADYQDYLLALRTKMTKALFYPTVVALAAMLITTAMMVFIVPQFKNIFNSFGAPLPLFTRTIITIADSLRGHIGYWVMGILMGSIHYHYFNRRSAWFRGLKDRVLLYMPITGRLLITAIFSRWARMMATLLTANLSLSAALAICAKTLTNRSMSLAMEEIIRRIHGGARFHEALSATPPFSRCLTSMIAVGENAGQLAMMLEKLAMVYQGELDRSIDYFSKWLEPMVMIILAIITGTLIIAMYLPIFKLGAVL